MIPWSLRGHAIRCGFGGRKVKEVVCCPSVSVEVVFVNMTRIITRIAESRKQAKYSHPLVSCCGFIFRQLGSFPPESEPFLLLLKQTRHPLFLFRFCFSIHLASISNRRRNSQLQSLIGGVDKSVD